MGRFSLEVVDIEEVRSIETIRDTNGTILELAPGPIRRRIVIGSPSGETFCSEVAKDDWNRVVAPLFEKQSAALFE